MIHLVLEMVNSELRTMVASSTSIMWAIGLSFLPLTVYLARSWVKVTMVSATVGIILIGLVK